MEFRTVLLFTLLQASALGQTTTQLIGRVVNINNGEGIENVEIQLVNTNDITISDAQGKFKFNNPKGFVIGERFYSFHLHKNGYSVAGKTDSKSVSPSGAIDNLTMMEDTDNFLWITVMDGKSNNFVEGVNVDIKGETKTTDKMGKVFFNCSKVGQAKAKVSFSRNCYQDDVRELDTRGEEMVKIIPICNNTSTSTKAIDISSAAVVIEQATQNRDGSRRGQIEALQFQLANGYTHQNSNFSGINFSGMKISNAIFDGGSFSAADLSSVSCHTCSFKSMGFKFAVLTGGSFASSDFSGSYAPFIAAQNADFTNAKMANVNFFSGDLRRANFSGADLKGSAFAFADLRGAIFDGADLTGAYLPGAILDSASFKNAIIANTEFLGSVAIQFNLTETQKKGACRHSYPEGKTTVDYAVKLINKRVSNQFSSGVEFDDIIDTRGSWGPLFRNFGDRSLPVCNCSPEGPTEHDSRFAGNEWIYLDDAYLSKGNREKLFYDRVMAHCKTLTTFLTKERVLKVKNEQRTDWEKTMKANISNAKPSYKPYLNFDLLNVLLAKQNLLDEKINWDNLAIARYRLESKIREKYQNTFEQFTLWPAFFPTSPSYIPMNELPENYGELYKSWTEERAKHKINTILMQIHSNRFIYYLDRKELPMERLIDCSFDSECIINANINRYPGVDIADHETTIEAPVFEYGYKYDNENYFFVFPEKINKYNCTLPELPDSDEYSCEVEFTFNKSEKRQISLKNKLTDAYLFFLNPKELRILKKGKVIWVNKY